MEFTETEAFNKINNFIEQINLSINREEQKLNNNVQLVIKDIKLAFKNTKPENGDFRYGNPAFTQFISKLSDIEYIKREENNAESKEYLLNSFGNLQRIDYGTGHELNFLCFLYVLYEEKTMKINEVFKSMDFYFDLVREIIDKYSLEPAGSHGAWGIDDYQILPFLFGSRELCNTDVTFSDLFDDERKITYGKAVRSINRQKTKHRPVPFKIHSPIIYELSQKSWPFVNLELMERYRRDVLDSKAVNQHFIYSSYLPNKVAEIKNHETYDFLGV